ncbi:MAG: DUF2782 domain-containing protein [Candidatus Sedimenticola endophacoides]
MKRTQLTVGLILTLATGFGAHAQQAPVPEPPDLPPQIESGEALEPEVTIRESKKGTIEQYSVNGRVYMVKVTPRTGPPYYLVDSDGDGQLDQIEDSPRSLSVPQWVLFRW